VWNQEEEGLFAVKFIYKKLEAMFILDDIWGAEEKKVFHQLWKSLALSKVVALS